MKISLETLGRIYAAGRNYANLFIGFATSIGLISVAQNKTLTDGLVDVYSGIAQIAHGFASIWQVLVVVGGPFVGAVIAWYAQRSAKTENQARAVVDAKPGTVIVTDPALANAVPSPAVMSRDNVRVVTK